MTLQRFGSAPSPELVIIWIKTHNRQQVLWHFKQKKGNYSEQLPLSFMYECYLFPKYGQTLGVYINIEIVYKWASLWFSSEPGFSHALPIHVGFLWVSFYFPKCNYVDWLHYLSLGVNVCVCGFLWWAGFPFPSVFLLLALCSRLQVHGDPDEDKKMNEDERILITDNDFGNVDLRVSGTMLSLRYWALKIWIDTSLCKHFIYA